MSLSYETLELEYSANIATIWMNRPDVFNAFNECLISEIQSVCQVLNQDEQVRVVVLAGRGKHFSAGADLNWMKRTSVYNFDQNLADARKFAEMLFALANLSKPTVARVHGAALGGGTGLAAACDIVVASSDSQFATSEAKFGIIPSVISPYVIRAIGARQALRYFQTAERFGAEKAKELGLVHEVVDVALLDIELSRITQNLMVGGPNAQQAAKKLINSIDGREIDMTVVEETAQRIALQRSTDEAKEGICSFLEKRTPAWMGCSFHQA